MPSWFVKSTNTDFDIRLETFFLRPRPTSEDKGRITSSMICLDQGNYMEHSIIVSCGKKEHFTVSVGRMGFLCLCSFVASFLDLEGACLI